MISPALLSQLLKHEGLRLKPYTDTVGKLTIGVGRNLTDKGISEEEAYLLLMNDLKEVIADLSTFEWYEGLDEIRKRVVIDMRFNLGPGGFRTFTNTIKAISEGRYQDAAQGMRRSKWARQVGRRAERLVRMMETGEDA